MSSHLAAVIVGLGNPGSEYEKTRHNVGFRAVNELVEKFGLSPFHLKKELQAELSEGTIEGIRVLVVKPTTFMNLSGDAVQRVLNFYKLTRAQCIVIYDDIDLPLGTLRVRPNGSAGTHNGMRSICAAIGTEFPRIRIGIDGRTPEQKEHQDLADYVLGTFAKPELAAIEKILDQIPLEVLKLLPNLIGG